MLYKEWDKKIWLNPRLEFDLLPIDPDRIHFSGTLIILIATLLIWILLAYYIGENLQREWLVFLSISAWVLLISIVLFPNRDQKFEVLSTFIPIIFLFYIILYGNQYEWSVSVVSTLFLAVSLVRWIMKLYIEFKKEFLIVAISSVSLFLTILTQLLLLIPDQVRAVIFSIFAYLIPTLDFWSSTQLAIIRFIGILTVFLLIFARAIHLFAKQGTIYPINYEAFNRLNNYKLRFSFINKFVNSFVAIFNYLIIPLSEKGWYFLKGMGIRIVSIGYRFVEVLSQVLSNWLKMSLLFLRFFILPISVSGIIVYLLFFSSHKLFEYIHSNQFSNLVNFFISYSTTLVLIPLCIVRRYGIAISLKKIPNFIEKIHFPHVCVLLLLCLVSGFLVKFNIKPYSFSWLSWISVFSWIFAIVVATISMWKHGDKDEKNAITDSESQAEPGANQHWQSESTVFPRHSEAAITPPPPRSLPAIQNIHGWTTQQVQALQQQTAQALQMPVEFRDTLKDGSQGPAMLVIPAGEFLMGSPENEPERQNSEGPQHKVVISKPLAMGRYAVTSEEYDRFCEATGRRKPDDKGWRRGRQPVINVSWEDCVAYCTWLSQETGLSYCLPTEAEWEYAARAGTKTTFWWGDDIDTTRANYDGRSTYRNGPKGEYRQQTVPVDAFQPNPFGLYQVHGNVWEWVQDSWHDNYEGAPVDGSAWVEAGGGPCVLRGGSWGNGPRRMCGAARTEHDPHYGDVLGGFRLARIFPFNP